MLLLSPNGYPVFIDVPQADIQGAGTAMHFELPLHGHNFPLMHRHEQKLIVALKGQLKLKSGPRVVAELATGQAVLLPSGVAHRILQAGEQAATVGIALWPGAVEQAFRTLAEQVAQQGFHKPAVIALLAGYGVIWDAAGSGHLDGLTPMPLSEAIRQLPAPLADALHHSWQVSALGDS